MTTFAEVFTKLAKQQDAFNATVRPNWISDKLKWRRAINVELVEFMEHLNSWKWWKGPNPDMRQSQMELIDILHFLLSDMMVKQFNISAAHARLDKMAASILQEQDRNNTAGQHTAIENDFSKVRASSGGVSVWDEHKQSITSKVGECFDFAIQLSALVPVKVVDFTDPEDVEDLNLEIEKAQVAALSDNFDVHMLLKLWKRLGFEVQELAPLYYAKNALNQFRQENGYKSSPPTYIKHWFDTREDNEHLFDVVDTYAAEISTADDGIAFVKARLGELYAKTLAQKKSA